MISIKIDTKSVLKQLADVKDRQVPFATSLAINRTAQKVKAKEVLEMHDVFDRPTPYVLNSVFIKPSTKTTLTASVGIKDQGRTPQSKILLAEIAGGPRRHKRYELALRSIGALPDGYYTVPGEAAKIDQYGGVSAGQIRQILSYFRANRDVGYISNSTKDTRAKLAKGTKTKYGISYFVGAPADGKAPLGIWMRIHSSFGTAIKPILIFVRSNNYEPIFDFEFVAKNTVNKEFNHEFNKAWEEAERSAK